MKIPPICARVIPKKDLATYLEMKEAIKNKDKNGGQWWQTHFYGIHSYRVTGFYKIVPLKRSRPGYVGKLIHCYKKDAQYISGYSVGGLLQKAEDVVWTNKGSYCWNGDLLKSERNKVRFYMKEDLNPISHFATRILVREDGKLESV
jgi:hypothetical protein